jgi:polyphosphate kinase 2 (PPK2 family)
LTKDKQKERLQTYLDHPQENWKFLPADLNEHALLDDYIQAYQDTINETGTEWAPSLNIIDPIILGTDTIMSVHSEGSINGN